MSANAATINCIIGTRAQLIKMAPVIRELERGPCRLNLVFTGQHRETMEGLCRDFGIQGPWRYLYKGKEITGIVQMAGWFVRCLWRGIRDPQRHFLLDRKDSTVFLVHGDTFSTLLGALLGKWFGATVAHVESGLRSFRIFHPFPEELTRLLIFRLSDVAFCPGSWAYDNMRNYRVKRIDTLENTIRDALDIAIAADRPRERRMTGEYAVFSIHRFENIFLRRQLTRIIELLEKAACHSPVIFVLHPATRSRLLKSRLLSRLERNPRIELVPRMGYLDFIALVSGAVFVVTDGGSNQEELSYLGVPTLLMRRATERIDGMGRSATLCNYDEKTLESFLQGLDKLRNPRETRNAVSPSQIVATHIQASA